jgi:hypothetical protein
MIAHLPIKILGHYAEAPPKRKLGLRCSITNPGAVAICIMDAWVRVDAMTGMVLADGKIFQSLNNRVDSAIIPPGKEGMGVFHIDLSSDAMYRIDQGRGGADLKLTFSSRVLVSEVHLGNKVPTLKPPYETDFEVENSARFEYLISQSEWIKVLRSLAWSELELLELPVSRFRSSPPLARALERFEEAQQNFRNGLWEETMLNCRKAFEAVVIDHGGKPGMGKAAEAFISILGNGEKAERFNDIVKSLGEFLHLGRHETRPDVSIKRVDAELAIFLTGGLLRYLGQP